MIRIPVLSHGKLYVLGNGLDVQEEVVIVCHEKVVRKSLEGGEILRVQVPGATPVAKSPYRLAPSKMQEWSEQLQELQDKGFSYNCPCFRGDTIVVFVKRGTWSSFKVRVGITEEGEVKGRVKLRRVRAMSMTIQSGVKDKILATSSETPKVENAPAEMLRDMDQQMERGQMMERVKPRRVRAMAIEPFVWDSVMSDSDESGVTYTEVSSPFKSLSDIGSPRADDHEYLELPGMPEDPYAPPSPDYVPGPEHADDESVAEDQPDAEDASPTAQSPDYVPESNLEADPEEDDDEDPEEDLVDYPTDGGDDGDDKEGSLEDDDINMEANEDKEEEEHSAPVDSIVVSLRATNQAPSAEETEPFETDESAATPPPHPGYRVTA
ncbi:hypothetical protein Tco_0825416 [Tanacetum coccineum]